MSAERKPESDGVALVLRSPWWSRAAILCVVAMSGLVVLLQMRQAGRTEAELTRWRDLREARLDLAKGFLHATESIGQDRPYSREQGRVLLNQGIARLQAELGASDQQEAQAFAQNARRFNERLEWWALDPNAGSTAELRAAFSALERAADGMDARLQAGLKRLTARHRQEFLAAIGLSLALLGVLCAVLLRVQHARARAERELAARESRFRRMAEGLPQLVWTWRPDSGCDYVSRRWLDYTGGDFESQLGDGWIEHMHPADRGHFIRVVSKAVEEGKAFGLQIRLRGRDGSHRWFDTRAQPLQDPEGHAILWLGSCTDIQRDRELREAAEAERNFSDALIDSLPGVFYLYDTAGKFLRWNRNFETVTGYDAAEIADMHPLDF
ncbi:MAG: PAS domain-containing protein, partial [Verrucomicrobiota bacterium]